MTVTVPRRGAGIVITPPARLVAGRRRAGRVRQWLARHPGWPLTAMLAGYPVWWALGLADESVVIMALPMLVQLRAWRQQGRPIKVPPAFGLWLMFLVCAVAGVATLSLSAPDTVVSSVSNRLLSYLFRGLTYVALTVVLLYIGNLTEDEVPRRKLAWLLGLVGIYTTLGGLGGVVAPHFQFASPLSYVLPRSMQSNTLLQQALYPGFSQVTDVLGESLGRPKAPFDYTNIWGECLTILLPFLIVAWWSYGNRRQRRLAVITCALALAPLVYSLNRTAWVGVGLIAVYLAIKMAARGKIAMMGMVCAGLMLVGVAVAVTPLQGIVTSRLQHQQSNSIRAALSADAILDANAAPLIGFGDTQHKQGSENSIAVGPTANCPSCGQYEVGSNGQLYTLLICTGWLGTFLYLGFFGYLGWRYRRDRTPYGMAGLLVILLSFLYMFAYVAITAPLEFTMIAAAILWRNDQWRRSQARR
jgi:polysaccharide biosynthesis protein PslJ